MAEINIKRAPKAYKTYFNSADKAGNNNGKIDSSKEAIDAAKRFYKANPTAFGKYYKFLMFLEGKGFKLLPSLASEGTIPLKSVLTRPAGRRRTLLYSRASYSFALTGKRWSRNSGSHYKRLKYCSSGRGFLSMCAPYFRTYNGALSIPLYPDKHSSRSKKENTPVVSGVGYKYTRLWRSLTDATHIQIDLKPWVRSKGYLIVEIYDADNKTTSVKKSKDRRNHWLPNKNVDLFKVRIPLSASRKWRTLTIPLSKFVDWNRKRATCRIPVPGVNQDIGDGKLNLKKRERFQVQVILEAEGYDKSFGARISEYVRFVKFIKPKRARP